MGEQMESVSKLVECCGCGRSSGESSSSSRGSGQHQSRTDAVITTQPGLVQSPMVVRIAKTVRQFTTRRRYPKPTWEQLEAFYQEGKELVRLQEEAEAAEKLRLQQQQQSEGQQQQQSQQDHDRDLTGQDPSQGIDGDAAIEPPNPHLTFDGPSDVPFLALDDDNENEPRLPPVAHVPLRSSSSLGQGYPQLDLGIRRVSNHNDRPLPALRQTGENTAISEADTNEIVAALADDDDADPKTPPVPNGGTQKSKKIKLFFQDDRSRSSVYPSDEESMIYPNGAWSPRGARSTRITSPAPSRLVVNKVRQNRHVSPGNLRIPSVMQVLSSVLSPSPAEAPKPTSPRGPVELSELPHPDEFELPTDDAPASPPEQECDIQSLPHPDEFEDVLLTPPASPLLNPQPDRSISPICSGVPFLKLEMERIRRRIESDSLVKSPWDNQVPKVPPPRDRAFFSKYSRREKQLAVAFGFLKMGSLSSLGALSSLSSLSLASNFSMQVIGSDKSPFFSPGGSDSGSVFYSDQVLAGLPPCAEAETPIHDTVVDATAETFAESLRKGGETIAKTISSGFTTFFKRFGTGTAELQSTEQEPEPLSTDSVPREPVRSAPAPGFTEGTPVLSPTPSTLTLMRTILGLKVSGTLCEAALASEAMSSGLSTSGYTPCGPDDKPENPFEGFVWGAPDGKIPWYCDEDGVHFDDKVPVNREIWPEYLVNPVMVPWEELSVELELPQPPRSTPAGAKGVRVRQLTPPAVAAPSTVAVGASSEVATLAATQPEGSLVRSAGPEEGMPEELEEVPSVFSSVDSFPRYIPTSNRDARHSTCGLDLGKERAFYQRYEDRIKSAVKPFMRGRRSFQHLETRRS
ncbi:hypothetical protein TWF481_003280 [Arthrobotrys musiformis]|uniref:Uncharacterized protein n=1 Tax=Arthrobotrys musiformis TaxID=47236 RepID=A0AAV9VRZ6_9PEZI